MNSSSKRRAKTGTAPPARLPPSYPHHVPPVSNHAAGEESKAKQGKAGGLGKKSGKLAHLRMELGSPASAPISPLALPRQAAVAGAPCLSGRALHGPAVPADACGAGRVCLCVAVGMGVWR